jgi:hypothetical protein
MFHDYYIFFASIIHVIPIKNLQAPKYTLHLIVSFIENSIQFQTILNLRLIVQFQKSVFFFNKG